MIENENLKRGKYLLINIVRRWKKDTIKKNSLNSLFNFSYPNWRRQIKKSFENLKRLGEKMTVINEEGLQDLVW